MLKIWCSGFKTKEFPYHIFCCLILRSLSCLFSHQSFIKIINRVKIKIRIQSNFQWTSIYLKHVGTFENSALSAHPVSFSECLSCFSRMWSALGEKIPGYVFAQRPRSQALILRALSAAVMLLNVPPLKWTFPRSHRSAAEASGLCRANLFWDTIHLQSRWTALPLHLNWQGWDQHGMETKAALSLLGNNGTALASAARKQVGNVFVLC